MFSPGTSYPAKQSTKSKFMLTWESTDKYILCPSQHGSRWIITFNLVFVSMEVFQCQLLKLKVCMLWCSGLSAVIDA